jgi:Coenzyme PQQ synthesis protein D (PqqD)
MNLFETVTIPPEVMARQIGDETVILDLASGNYFGLDPVGTRVWQLLAEGKTLAATCDILLGEYDVSRQDLERDLVRLVQELRTRGLIGL